MIPPNFSSNEGAVDSTILDDEKEKATVFKKFYESNLLIPSRHIQLIKLIGQGNLNQDMDVAKSFLATVMCMLLQLAIVYWGGVVIIQDVVITIWK